MRGRVAVVLLVVSPPYSRLSAPGRDGDVAAEAVRQDATQLEARETSETAVR